MPLPDQAQELVDEQKNSESQSREFFRVPIYDDDR